MLPTLDVGLLSAAPLNGAKRRWARDRTNSPTVSPSRPGAIGCVASGVRPAAFGQLPDRR